MKGPRTYNINAVYLRSLVQYPEHNDKIRMEKTFRMYILYNLIGKAKELANFTN